MTGNNAMSLIERIYSTGTLNADYFVLLSVFTLLWFIGARLDRSSGSGKELQAAFASVSALYISRMLGVMLRTGRLEEGGIWTVAALILNTAGLFFTALFSLKVLNETRAGEHDAAGDQSEGSSCNGSYLLRHSLYAAGAGLLSAYTLAAVGTLSLTISQIAGFGCLAAALRIFSVWIPRIKRCRINIKKAVIVSSLLLGCSWIAFHAMYAFLIYAPLDLLLFSRTIDLLFVSSLIIGFQRGRVEEKLKYRDKAATSSEEVEKSKEELQRLQNITSQIFEDNSEMVKKLRSQTRLLIKKSENLEKLLSMGQAIQKKRNLKELLQMIVELVRENLGFNTVILRLLIEKSQSFESKAFVGLSEEVKDTVLNYRIPKSEFEKIIEPRFKISRSYFIKNSSPWYGEDIEQKEKYLVNDTWREVDMLIVPMIGEDNKLIGYLSVEDPRDVEVPVADVIENLENIAGLAVIAIKNANLFKEMEEKNEKLRVYTEKLKSLNKMKSDFVATVSHEFKTPLTSIKAYCETLINNSENMDRKIFKEFLMIINEESDRLMTLIEDILSFSQMESGAIKFERASCNLNELVNTVSKEQKVNFETKNIALQIDLPEKDVKIRADRDLIKQLLVNLINNAAKFTRDGGRVFIYLEDEMVSARIIVEDNGIGVPENQMERIFDHFHQADNSSTRRHSGSGLGLALCKNIVEWHDGRIWVENVDGGGARFVAVIPKKQAVVRRRDNSQRGPMRRLEIERYLELLIEMVAELLMVKRASLMLFDLSRTELKIESAIGIDEDIVENVRVKIGDSISGKVVEEGETYLVEDIENDPRTGRVNNEFVYESKSFLSVPIKINGEIIGVVNAANPIKKEHFTQEDKNLLELFVERISHAIQKLEEFNNVSEDFEKIRITLKSILDTKRYIDVQNEFEFVRVGCQNSGKIRSR